MLKSLHIKNIVLIKELNIDFFDGFSVFSGETGAGKSILLDSISLILGERANFNLIRKGENTAQVSGVFTISQDHPSIKLLNNNLIDYQDEIIIRRVITSTGKSKSFINDTLVSVNFLKSIGVTLLDIHGQFDNHKLLNPLFHQSILDSFVLDKTLFHKVETSWQEYKSLQNDYTTKLQEINDLNKEVEYIEYSLEELNKLSPREFEENDLLEKKHLMSNGRKIIQNISNIESYLVNNNYLSNLHKVIKNLDTISSLLNNSVQTEDLTNDIHNLHANITDIIDKFYSLSNSLNFDEKELVEIEERLMEIRSIAKKHKVSPSQLPKVHKDLEEKLNKIQMSDHLLHDLDKKLKKKYEEYLDYAKKLSKERKKTALKVDNKVNEELQFLKLINAKFSTDFSEEVENKKGLDKIVFKVKTNIGGDFSDLNKVASGGEMARFMLALKLVLSEVESVNTIILDEIDMGVSGEVAEAIGKRLLNSSKNLQIMIITHSPQLAAKGEHHYKVVKNLSNHEVFTELLALSKEERIEEIARMLSGETITQQAKIAASEFIG